MKLIIGVFSIILSIFITFQSLIAGLGNALFSNNEVGGTGGILVAIIMLATGIITIVQRNSISIAPIVLYTIAATIGYLTAGSYADLYIWSTLCLIFAIIIFFTHRRSKAPEISEQVNKNVRSHHSPKDNSTIYIVLIAIIIVGFADIFFNFSGLNILESIQSSNHSDDEVIAHDEQVDQGNIIETDSAIIEIKNVWIEKNEFLKDNQIAFEYEFTNKSDQPVGVDTDWLFLFSAVQDNDPNIVNKLTHSSPNQYGIEEYAEVKPGGTMTYGQAYILDDEVTPVTLTAIDILNGTLWEKEFEITALLGSNTTVQESEPPIENSTSVDKKKLVALDILKPEKSKFKILNPSIVNSASNTTSDTGNNNTSTNSTNSVTSSENSTSNNGVDESELAYWDSMAALHGFQTYNGFGDPNQFIEAAKQLTYNAETYGYAYYSGEDYYQEESYPDENYNLYYEDDGILYENPMYNERYGPEESSVEEW